MLFHVKLFICHYMAFGTPLRCRMNTDKKLLALIYQKYFERKFHMKKTTLSSSEEQMTVDIRRLQSMLGVGLSTARKIAHAAKSEISCGRRKMYSVQKIRDYIAEKAGTEQ